MQRGKDSDRWAVGRAGQTWRGKKTGCAPIQPMTSARCRSTRSCPDAQCRVDTLFAINQDRFLFGVPSPP